MQQPDADETALSSAKAARLPDCQRANCGAFGRRDGKLTFRTFTLAHFRPMAATLGRMGCLG